MSKSILVIDTPKNCGECKFSEYQGIVCREMGSNKAYNNADNKPDWCPIQDFPEKKPEVKYQGNGCFGINEAVKNSFNMGFNSCIEEILKGVNRDE